MLKPKQGGRIAASKQFDEESPSVMKTGYRITSGWRNPRESATESYRRFLYSVRLKRRGKSSPQK